MKPAVVISTYNHPTYLAFCLRSLSNQSHADFDIFIADDGSTEETRLKIDELRRFFPKSKLTHCWQEDHGFRKAKIHNEAFRQAKNYPFIVCVDGDTFVHRRFIEDHVAFHMNQRRILFMGRRIDLGKKISGKLKEEDITRMNRGLSRKLIASGIGGDSKNIFRAVRIAPKWVRKLLNRDRVGDLLGSNFSVSTELLFEVNGYDENFQGYWGEDGDLFIRLRNAGANLCGSKSLAIQYHLYHERRETDPARVTQYFSQLEKRDYKRCEAGIVS